MTDRQYEPGPIKVSVTKELWWWSAHVFRSVGFSSESATAWGRSPKGASDRARAKLLREADDARVKRELNEALSDPDA